MLVSYNWLKEMLNIDGISAQELADKMSLTGIEVENVEYPSANLKNIVVGKVMECIAHPDSDHLSVCQVDVGEEELYQIVCGAPNVKEGIKVIVALPGARIAGNYKIKKGKIRGYVSMGMICSLQEIGINESVVAKDFAEGIYYLPEDATIGTEVFGYLGMDDAIIELSITPNRADALSMRGVAHEVGAIYKQAPVFKEEKLNEDTNDNIDNYISVKVEDENDAPTYLMRVIKNVKIAPSPMWLQNRLMNMGIRPINNVVDVTNYILLYFGQPMHAFDYAKLASKEILVRRAENGEKLTTLDNEERELTSENIVITNGTKPVALAGVMGGANTEIDANSTTVALEAALFDGLSIRKTSKQFNLRSESSARFEKGINVATVELAADVAAAMIAELAGGTVVKGIAKGSHKEADLVEIKISTDRINGSLGTQLTNEEIGETFKALDFPYSVEENEFSVVIPPRRWDITIEADIVEEVARIYGYDNLPSTLPASVDNSAGLSAKQALVRKVQNIVEGAGLNEIIAYALTTEEKAQQFALETTNITKLDWPMSEERSALRTSLISGMLDNLAYNVARKNSNLAFYEIGRVFHNDNDTKTQLPKEKDYLAMALTGLWQEKDWQNAKVAVDYFTIKGIVDALFAKLEVPVTYEAWTNSAQLHPGRTAKILLNDEVIGFVGQVHPNLAKTYDLAETYVAEINLEAINDYQKQARIFAPISKFPVVTRDIALLVDEKISNQAITQAIYQNGTKLLKEVTLFDLFAGEKLGKDKKSLAYTLKFSNIEQTLTDEEINAAMSKIEKKLVENFGVEIR